MPNTLRQEAPVTADLRSTPTSRADAVRARKTPRHFRADIQALRAIAVTLVVIYHLRPNRMPGGYIGVDVFFVISGFLITSHLIREASRTGRVKLGAFWAARARRILPASLVAIAATVAITSWLAPVTLFEDLRKQALASIFYVQNWVLAADSVDYSAAENDATAFQHFWTLSVEEQFYLFWPVLVLAALWIVTRKATSPERGTTQETRLRRVLTVLFGIVVLASLAYSIYAVADGQANAYFVTTARVWELGAGGMLAAIGVRRLSRFWRYVLCYLGLAAIAGSAFILTNETPFPGLAALPVILGTVAVILAGTPALGEERVAFAKYDPWTFASRLNITQWIGDRSYSLYLWHFPVIIMWTMITDRKVDYLDIIGMFVVSFVLAHFSYRFIEQPLRGATYFKNSTFRSLIAALISMLIVAGLTFAYPVMMTRAASGGDWDALAAQARALPTIGAEATVDNSVPTFTTSAASMTPSPLTAGEDRNLAFSDSECVGHARDDVTPTCTAGNAGAELSIALVGDSHARMYSTALAEMAEGNGWFLRTYLHNTCPFNPVPRELEVRKELVCTDPNAVVLDKILKDPPDLVITTWSFAATLVEDNSTGLSGAAGFAKYWNTLEDAGIEVLVIRDAPRMAESIPDCVAQHYEDPDECATPRKDALIGSALLKDAVELAPGVAVADLTDNYCTEVSCKPVVGNVLVYQDTHHITDTFAVSMIPQLTEEVDEALASR